MVPHLTDVSIAEFILNKTHQVLRFVSIEHILDDQSVDKQRDANFA